MKENTFSIIIPTHNRQEQIMAAVKAVLNQTYKVFELIVIDDGTYPVPIDIYNIQDPRLIIIRRNVRHQRVIARNMGMQVARHEWLCWGDDDDLHEPTYLEKFNDAINTDPEDDIGVWQCAAQFYKMIDGKEVKVRLLPPMVFYEDIRFKHLDDGLGVYPYFPSGRITTGQFIFRKDCLRTIGYMPYVWTAGDFAVKGGVPGYGWLDPQPPRFLEKRCQVMGNPWGEDYFIMYQLARYFKIGSINDVLYRKGCR